MLSINEIEKGRFTIIYCKTVLQQLQNIICFLVEELLNKSNEIQIKFWILFLYKLLSLTYWLLVLIIQNIINKAYTM